MFCLFRVVQAANVFPDFIALFLRFLALARIKPWVQRKVDLEQGHAIWPKSQTNAQGEDKHVWTTSKISSLCLRCGPSPQQPLPFPLSFSLPSCSQRSILCLPVCPYFYFAVLLAIVIARIATELFLCDSSVWLWRVPPERVAADPVFIQLSDCSLALDSILPINGQNLLSGQQRFRHTVDSK